MRTLHFHFSTDSPLMVTLMKTEFSFDITEEHSSTTTYQRPSAVPTDGPRFSERYPYASVQPSSSEAPYVSSEQFSAAHHETTSESVISMTDTTTQTVMNVVTQNMLQPENAIDAGCEIDSWNIKVNASILGLIYPDVRSGSIYLGEANCQGKLQAGLLKFQQGFNTCGTTIMVW